MSFCIKERAFKTVPNPEISFLKRQEKQDREEQDWGQGGEVLF
jgi:hypothetical protein